jgi:hypothetical protein
VLTRCTNPECNEQFKYLGEGRIYLDNPGEVLTLTQDQLYERCYWLCTFCSQCYEIKFDRGTPKLVPVRLRRAAG